MGSKRHELPRKKPGRSAKDEIADDLPTLEPLADELPTLEPLAEDLPTLEPVEPPEPPGPVQWEIQPTSEAGCALALVLTVAEMDKKAVPDALAGPLGRVVQRRGAELRHRAVLVRFAGPALIGTAAKDKVAELLKPAKPCRLVVRRGYGDEVVHEAPLPTVALQLQTKDGALHAVFDTAALEAADLPVAVAAKLPELVQAARGARVQLQFQGAAKPDAALRRELQRALQDAGAVRAALGARLLFDVELQRRVQVTLGQPVLVAVQPAADEAATLEAFDLVLPAQAAALRGKAVRVHAAAPLRDGEQQALLALLQAAAPQRIEFGPPGGDADVVWPALLQVAAGAEPVVQVVPNGRSAAALAAAFRRECGGHAAALRGQPVVVEWPAGTSLDGEVAALLDAARAAWQPERLATTVAGEQREPWWPEPVAFGRDGGTLTVQVDVDAGKPTELLRAFERRSAAARAGWRGQPVRVSWRGAAAASRTLRQSVFGAVEQAGAARLEVQDGAAIDVLRPALLAIDRLGDRLALRADAGGRTPEQVAAALARELDAAGVARGAAVTVGAGPLADAVVAAVLARGAARVWLDGASPVQVHPPLFAAPERRAGAVRLVAAPGADAAMVQRQLARELPALLPALTDPANLTVTLAWPGAEAPAGAVAEVVQALVGHGVAKVLLEPSRGKTVPVHPPQPVAAPAPAATAAPAAAASTAAPAAPAPAAAPLEPGAPTGIAVLLRRDEGAPPVLVLGVPAGDDPAHVAAVEAGLQAQLPRLRGRAVLVVPRQGDQDAPVRKPGPLVAMLGRVLPGGAAATLVFRGPDAQGRPHFQVLHSTLRALPVGATFADPRARR